MRVRACLGQWVSRCQWRGSLKLLMMMLMTIAEVVVAVVSSVRVCVCVCVCDNKTNQKNTVFVVCLPQGISKV